MNFVEYAALFADALAKHGLTSEASGIREALRAEENPDPAHSHINFTANVLKACCVARAACLNDVNTSNAVDLGEAIHALGGYLAKSLGLRIA